MAGRALPLAASLALACAAGQAQLPLPLTPVPDEEPGAEFLATGEVLTRDRSASFDDWRVVGPQVNIVRRDDGTWAGTLLGQNLIARPGPGSLSGSGVNLHFVRWGGDIVVRGTLGTRSVNVRVRPGPGLQTPSGMFCRFQGNFIDCEKEPASVDPGAELRGQAARLDEPVMPQLGIALVAVTVVGVQF
jgi:hypothetical protein